MHLNISFLTSLRVNIGDEFIREGIRAGLDQSDIPYSPFYIDKVDARSLHEPREEETIRLDDKYWDADVVIQAGAPVYWSFEKGRISSLNSEWYEWFWQQLVFAPGKAHPVFLNLGAGSCQPWGDNGDEFLQDPNCVRYARRVAERSALTTVRDPVAADMLGRLGVPHQPEICPAFFAASRRVPRAYSEDGPIGVNLMPVGGHYDYGASEAQQEWGRAAFRLVGFLRELGRPLVFIAHDKREADFMNLFAAGAERVILGESWRPYLDAYADCALVVANRVHGAVCAAGCGVPSLIVGNDTRTRIGDYVGLPSFRAHPSAMNEITRSVRTLFAGRASEHERLVQLRRTAFPAFVARLKGSLPAAERSAFAHSSRAVVRSRHSLGISPDELRAMHQAVGSLASIVGISGAGVSQTPLDAWVHRQAFTAGNWAGRQILVVGKHATAGTQIVREASGARVVFSEAGQPISEDVFDAVVVQVDGADLPPLSQVVSALKDGGVLALLVLSGASSSMTPEQLGVAFRFWYDPVFGNRPNSLVLPADVTFGGTSASLSAGFAMLLRRSPLASPDGLDFSLVAGWHAKEGEDESGWIWSNGEGTLLIRTLRYGRVRITAEARSIHAIDQLVASVDGEEVRRIEATDQFAPIPIVEIALTRAVTLVAFLSTGGSLKVPGDPRELAFALKGLKIELQSPSGCTSG